jgi:hypothetical protein
MGIRIKWDDSGRVPEHTVIFWEFDEAWTWKEYSQRAQEAYEWQMQSPKAIHTIVDMRRSRGVFSGDALSSIVRGIRLVPTHRGTVAVVGANRFIAMLEPIVRRLVPDLAAYYNLVDSLDEAYELILGVLNRQTTGGEM